MSSETKKLQLEDFGYDDFFDSSRKSLNLADSLVARVVSEHRGAYKVKNPDGEYLARITGKQMYSAQKREDYPAVGDWVVIKKLDSERAVIQSILPRKTILRKKYSNKQDAQVIATNIDVAFIVESIDRDYNLNRFERYFVLISEGGAKPAIVLNKIDLISETDLNQIIKEIKDRFPEVDIILTSAVSGQGFEDLLGYIKPGKTYCFVGSSGVGKSSLINKLLKTDIIKTGEISGFTGRGKHTTTTREMYFLENGGIVIDNPGTREVGIAEAATGLENVFEEIASLSKECRYADCTHTHEPGCAVLKFVETKKLDEDKYQNYIRLKKESDYSEMTNLEKRQKDRKFGKFVKKALEKSREFES